MNGKKLTKAQIKKVERIDKLFADLKNQGVKPLIIESGGHPSLTFFRNADTYEETLRKNRHGKNVFHTSNTLIDMWVP